MASSAQQVQELAQQMQQLKFEKQRLEAQNRVLQHTVRLSTRHIQDTVTEGVCRSSASWSLDFPGNGFLNDLLLSGAGSLVRV